MSTCAFVTLSLGCRCAPLRLDTYYCKSDFAVQIKVKSQRHDTEDQLNSWYDIDLVKVYKTNPSPVLKTALNASEIWTGQNGAVCGRFFEVNQNYVITGYYDEEHERLRTHTCTFGRLISELTKDEKDFFDTTFKSIDCSKIS